MTKILILTACVIFISSVSFAQNIATYNAAIINWQEKAITYRLFDDSLWVLYEAYEGAGTIIGEATDVHDDTIVEMHAILEYDVELGKMAQRYTVPTAITLSNFPNPFNPSTDITYGIPEETHVKLAVYDNLGREVKVLANGWKSAGTYTVTFDAAELPSGMYLYRIETAKGSVSKKMMLMK